MLQGRYLIERVLGHGGMGYVYLAVQPKLANKPVAIKEMLYPSQREEQRAAARSLFHREAETLAMLDHPGLVGVTDYFEQDDRQYLVMEFINGRTLQDLLDERAGWFDAQQVLRWASEICEVLGYLHRHDPAVVLRDLKPANIMLDARGRIRVIDFGIARHLNAADPESKTNTLIRGAGTPGYAPLEQYSGGGTDQRTDIYALGATMYTLLTGKVPAESVDRVVNGLALVPPSAYNPTVPAALDRLVERAMALLKQDRYESVNDVASALTDIAAEKQTEGGVKKVLAESGLRVIKAAPLGNATARTTHSGDATLLPGLVASAAATAAAPLAATPTARVPVETAPATELTREGTVIAASRAAELAEKLQSRLVDSNPDAVYGYVLPEPRQGLPRRLWLAWAAVGALFFCMALPGIWNPGYLSPFVWLNLPLHTLATFVVSIFSESRATVALWGVAVQFYVPAWIVFIFAARRPHFLSLMLGICWLCENLLEIGAWAVLSRLRSNPLPALFDDYAQDWLALFTHNQKFMLNLAPKMHVLGGLGMVAALVFFAWRLYDDRP